MTTEEPGGAMTQVSMPARGGDAAPSGTDGPWVGERAADVSRLGLADPANTSGVLSTLSGGGTTTTLERAIAVDPDAVEVVVTVRVSGDATADPDSRASAVVHTPDGDETVLDLDGGTSGVVTREVTVEAVAGRTVTVEFRASDGATLTVREVSVEARYDSDGDGLTNAEETNGFRVGTGERVYTNPYSADTDGDGLFDSEEIGRKVSNEFGTYYIIHSDPTKYDTDRDGLDDFQERAWETEAMSADTDDDGYADDIDPDPTVESRAPMVRITSEEPVVNQQTGEIEYYPDYNENITVRVSDDSAIRSISVLGYYDTQGGDTFFAESTPTLIAQDSDSGRSIEEYTVPLKQAGVLNEPPEYYYVNVTDEHGNTVSLRLDPNETTTFADTVDATSSVALGGLAISGVGSTGGGTATAGGVGSVGAAPVVAAVGIGAAIGTGALYADYNQPAAGYRSEAIRGRLNPLVPTEEIILTFPAAETGDELNHPIRLPRGKVYDAPTGFGENVDRGFGWEYIKRTPGISEKDDIGEILRVPSSVVRQRDRSMIIGETNEGDRITLEIASGVLVAATTTVSDVQGRDVEIGENVIDKIINKNDWDHNQVGNSRETVRSRIEEILKSPAEVYKSQNQDRWMYAKRFNIDGRVITIVLFVQDGSVATAFAPTLNGYAGGTGHSEEFVRWYMKRQGMEKQYQSNDVDPITPRVDVGERPTIPSRDEMPEP
ncbi:hypothetical protein [Halobaculum sp. EA56]|uniref:hypothetical protein n=1 Tax=Halobaculum sp. EA56 TaxID=3421648 RepID=UPI003EBFDC0E